MAFKNALPPDTKPVMVGYKEPLTPVKDGFGYYGVIAYDESKKYTQCHICGYFFKALGVHVRNYHEKNPVSYRIEYGLGIATPLTAPSHRVNFLEQWNNMTPEEKAIRLKNLKEGRAKGYMAAYKKGGQTKKSLHQKNLEGRCPEQLLDKIKQLADKLGKTPTQEEFKRAYVGDYLTSVKLTFGSWNEAVRTLGLTVNDKHGKPQYNEESLLLALRNFKKEYGREPVTKDVKNGLLPTMYTFKRYFGSWAEAKERL